MQEVQAELQGLLEKEGELRWIAINVYGDAEMAVAVVGTANL